MGKLDINRYLKEKKQLVDRAIKKYFVAKNALFPMMYYSVDSGKRIRPILAITSFEANGGKGLGRILPIACGLELIHTYSLIHDDLPAMDNDDFRRGKLSSHKKFGEANAILAGDGLFAYAFELFSRGNDMTHEKISVIRAVSEVVGPQGIVFGQLLDISDNKEMNPRGLRQIHLNKTAKFIALAIKVGAIMAQAPKRTVERLHNAGLDMGMLFQYTDDILDVVGKREKLGKTPGKDVVAGKLTAPAVYGLNGAKERARQCAQNAKRKFTALGTNFKIFVLLTDLILNRTF